MKGTGSTPTISVRLVTTWLVERSALNRMVVGSSLTPDFYKIENDFNTT